ncbi:hypothetical protein [Pedobacter caeni]|uniref:Uncharacterized protein n=1 Tax=Pedobacter caeni TaxID=288992 RepID=A0A1M5F2P8_9SPHI|nr:hypothetical protein [Pedobacter caeni]SHF85432.1 hypothetical protein SAMN04488522_103898 [Pedobacter caeni]
MGYDISYHPINETEIREWYFDVLNDPELISGITDRYQVDDFYKEKYQEVINIGLGTNSDDSFERSHGYYIAVVQGFLRKYYYTRGSAFSFLLEERPHFEKYTKDFKTIAPDSVGTVISNRIVQNYSSGVFIPAGQVVQLLADYENDPSVKADLDAFFSDGRIKVFLKALEDAKQQGLGLLEATEVVEPNPLNLNDSACYSNLFNCDQEGAYLFKAAAMAQMKAIEEQNNLQPGEISNNAERVVMNHEEVKEQEKKGFWKKLFG